MKILGGVTNATPELLIIDNWYSSTEEKRIWKELNFYTESDKFEKAESTEIATNEKGEHLGEHYRVHLNKLYTREALKLKISDILNYFSKLQTKEFLKAIKSCSPSFGKTFAETNTSFTLISYYENNHYYKPHHDSFFWTILIWFYKEPKSFIGGNLIFTEFDNYVVECKHNRLIAFPSYYLHGVETIKIPEEKRGQGLGRYTITHFFHYDNNIRHELTK